jgi:predicted ester cyclase
MKNLLFSIFAMALLALGSCTNPTAENATTTDDGSAAATAAFNSFFNDVINGHNTAKLDEILHPDFQSHHYPAPPGSDKAGFTQGIKDILAAFPDIKIKLNDQFVKGGKVFAYFSWTGTHQGVFMGIPPTGKQVTVEGMDIWRVQDGKLIENWVIMDGLGLMIQLGVVPPPGSVPKAEK